MPKLNNRGFSVVVVLVIVIVVAALGLGGYFVWHKNKDKDNKGTTIKTSESSKSSSTGKQQSTPTDPYAGWQSAKSPRAGFTVKYPAGWTYIETVGTNDNVEHITIDSSKFHIMIDSFNGKDPANGGQSATTCPDCLQTVASTSFTAPKLGTVDLKTIRYKLDSGEGNALILERPDATYYIPSPAVSNVTTSFRGISALDSEQAYQAESTAQFTSGSDYATAQKIFESIAY